MGLKGWCWFLVVAAWVGSPLYHSKGTCCVFGDSSGVLWPPLAGGRSGLGMIDKHVVVVLPWRNSWRGPLLAGAFPWYFRERDGAEG